MKIFQFDYTDKRRLITDLRPITGMHLANPSVKVIFQIYADDLCYKELEDICRILDKEVPYANYFGCSTTGNIVRGAFSRSHIYLCCTVFEKPSTRVAIFQHELVGRPIEDVNADIERDLTSCPGAKSASLIVSMVGMSTRGAFNSFVNRKEPIIVFGGGAYNAGLTENTSLVFSKTGGFSETGFVMMLTGGDDYHLETYHVRGWKPLGKKFAITRAERNHLYELDGEPAINIYTRYLNVKNDNFFKENTYEFPFLVSDDQGETVLRTPVVAYPDGSILLFSDVDTYSEMALTYGDPSSILMEIRKKAEKIYEFNPESIQIFSCLARHAFWGDDKISDETAFLNDIAPTYGFYTSGEILSHEGNLNRHNQTLVIVAMREGESYRTDTAQVPGFVDDGPLSLNNRLVHFVDVATEEILEANEQLDNLNKEIAAQKNEADRANNAKTNFLANMSHEIRTPINAILGFNTLITRETDNPDILAYTTDIERSGNTLLSLVNEILDLSKIESGQMEVVNGPYNLKTLINDVVNTISVKAEEKGLVLDVIPSTPLPSTLLGDEVKIRQVLINLLNNAVKYTERGSVTLRISSFQTEAGDASLSFAVEDTGTGIKEEDMGRLFEKFKRIEENRNKYVEGSGLGMPITVQLLALMDSKINVESTYGHGSTFSFDIVQPVIDSRPISKLIDARRIEPGTVYKAVFEAPDAQILLVDDNDINRRVFVNLLKKTRLNIDEADGGNRALLLSKAKKYDIIFMDHMMPDMNGDEVLSHIREDRSNINRDTPVIALTANAMAGSREAFLGMGFDEFLCKPFKPSTLEQLIKSFLPESLVAEPSGAARVNKPSTAAFEAVADASTMDIGESVIPAVEGIDADYALTKLPTEEMLLDTMKDFIKGSAGHVTELNKFYETLKIEGTDEALNAYKVKVHGMKSSAAYIGAVSVSGLARFLEYAARDRKLAEITTVHSAFIAEWNDLTERLSEAIKPDKAPVSTGTIPFDADFFIMKIKVLNESLQDMDIDKADAILAQLYEYETSEELGALLEELSTAVTNIDIISGDALTRKILELLGG